MTEIEKRIDSWKGEPPAVKEFFKKLSTQGLHPGIDPDKELMLGFDAFAVMVTQSWKRCRYASCKRAKYCLSPAGAKDDPAISPKHRAEMASRLMPPCLIEPGWQDNLKDFVMAELREFDLAWKQAWVEAGYEVPAENRSGKRPGK